MRASAARREATPAWARCLARRIGTPVLPCPRGPRPPRVAPGRARPARPSARGRSGPGRPAGSTGYDAMTDLPRALRERLAEEVPFSTLELADQAESRDGTVKALFRTRRDGRPVEAVLMRYRGRARLALPELAVRLPADVHVLRDRPDDVRAQPHRLRDPRPGPALPAHGGRRPRRLHGHGRADDEPRRGPRRLRAPARRRDHEPPHGDLDRGLGARGSTASPPATGRSAWPCPCTPPTRRCAARSCPSTTSTRCATCWRPASGSTTPSAAGCSSST